MAALWRGRFIELGIEGLLQDAPRPGRTPTISRASLIEKTTQSIPSNATQWSTRTMAREMGISKASVSRIWRANGLKPHRVESFKVSNDPQFAEKLEASVGLYLNPPEHALVLSVDQKSQIQALDRTQPGLPMKSASWLNMIERFFRDLTTNQIRRGVFQDLEQIITAIGTTSTTTTKNQSPSSGPGKRHPRKGLPRSDRAQ